MSVDRFLRRYRGPLASITQPLHHWIESGSVLGRLVSQGAVTPMMLGHWYSIDLGMHRIVEKWIPTPCRRVSALVDDLVELDYSPVEFDAIRDLDEWVRGADYDCEHERRLTGVAYVVVGSAFGAAVIERALPAHFPRRSLVMTDRETHVAYLEQLRRRADCAYAAMRAFAAVENAARQAAVELKLVEG